MAKRLIIDAHLHMFPTKEYGRVYKKNYEMFEYGLMTDLHESAFDGDVEDVLKALSAAGASRGVVVNMFDRPDLQKRLSAELPADLTGAEREKALKRIDMSMGDELKKFNMWLCKLAQDNPELVPFIAMDPHVLSPAEGQAHLRQMVQQEGAKGVKIHPRVQNFYVNDSRMHPIYRTCVELGLPIIAHAGPVKGNEQYAEPKAFAPTLKAFPDLRIVLAHLGGASWRQVPTIARAFPNAYFDCCEIIEWIGASQAPSQRELAQLILEVGPERVMMGSDFPWYDIERNVELVMKLPLLSKEQKEGILGPNAVSILKLKL